MRNDTEVGEKLYTGCWETIYRLVRNYAQAGDKLYTGWQETIYRLVRNYIKLVRHFIQADEKRFQAVEKLYTGC